MLGHWAAGGGHIECLGYLMRMKQLYKIGLQNMSRHRRRDGKTALHYAARYGQIRCIEVIRSFSLEHKDVDVKSGDGTTPLHLACYGAHFETAKFLIEECGADINKQNEWGCDVSHWACMSVTESIDQRENCIKLCNYLKSIDMVFTNVQRQGHTPLHKAAQKNNEHVIKWLANNFDDCDRRLLGAEDKCGNRPSDIFLSTGGSEKFAKWMKDECGW